MNEMTIFDDHASRHEKAWTAFNRIYLLERPQPRKPGWWVGLPWMMFPFGVIAVAGILLSSMRTAPVFYNVALPLVGQTFGVLEMVLAIIVVEVFVVMIRYAMIILNPDQPHDINRWMLSGFVVALTVALFANLYGSVSHLEFLARIKPLLDLVIGIVVGVSAPFFAVISGDILGILWTRSAANRAQLIADFELQMDNWVEKRENSWNSKKKDYGIRIEVPSLPSDSIGNSIGNGMENRRPGALVGHSKNRNAREIVEQYFDQHSNAVDQDPMEIARLLQVGKSTVYTVRSERKQK